MRIGSAAANMAACSSVACSFPTRTGPQRRVPSSLTSSRLPRLPAAQFRQLRSLFADASPPVSRLRPRASVSASAAPSKDYEFVDGNGEVELRLDIQKLGIESSKDVFVDVDDTSLLIRAKSDGTLRTLMNVQTLFDRIKSSETIWFIDEDQLVVNLKKVEHELKWPDIDESWESLTSGITQLLTGISVHIVGDSTDINEAVAKEIAEGIGYLPVCTSELLESATQKSIDTWVASEGVDSVAEAESVVLESLSSHVRTVVATLGGKQGAASRFDKWQYLHSGFTVWLSVSDASDEATAREEARRSVSSGSVAYAKADVVVKLGGWDPEYTRAVAQGCLVALKQLTLADKKLAGTVIPGQANARGFHRCRPGEVFMSSRRFLPSLPRQRPTSRFRHHLGSRRVGCLPPLHWRQLQPNRQKNKEGFPEKQCEKKQIIKPLLF